MTLFQLTLLTMGAGFLIGSIPFGVFFNKIFKGQNLRKVGSGSTGTTNVLRSAGIVPAVLTLTFDALKGIFAMLITMYLFKKHLDLNLFQNIEQANLSYFTAIFLSGFMAVVGHCFSPFLKFKGGKGFATVVGMVAFLQPEIFTIGFLIFFCVFLISKYISLSTITCMVLLPVLVYVFNVDFVWEKIAMFSALSLFVIARHHANVDRLIAGNENKIDFDKIISKKKSSKKSVVKEKAKKKK